MPRGGQRIPRELRGGAPDEECGFASRRTFARSRSGPEFSDIWKDDRTGVRYRLHRAAQHWAGVADDGETEEPVPDEGEARTWTWCARTAEDAPAPGDDVRLRCARGAMNVLITSVELAPRRRTTGLMHGVARDIRGSKLPL